jgi:hypothetical protein
MDVRLHRWLAAAAFGLCIAVLGAAGPVRAAEIGDTQSCVALKQIDDSRVIDNKTIVLRVLSDPAYRRIDLATECFGLAFSDGFSSATSVSQLCTNDIIKVTRDPVGSQCTIESITIIGEDEAKALIATRRR